MYLAMYLDPQGLPRAYGKAPDAIDAQAIAQIELDAYRDAKRAVGDPLAALMRRRLIPCIEDRITRDYVFSFSSPSGPHVKAYTRTGPS